MSRVNRYEYQDWRGFGKRIKRYREQIGMTKEKFAEMINRSENYVAELQKGNIGCSVHTLHQISKVLKVSTDDLLYNEDINTNNEDTDKEILKNIIERCKDDELSIIKDIIVATFPSLDKIKEKRKI